MKINFNNLNDKKIHIIKFILSNNYNLQTSTLLKIKRCRIIIVSIMTEEIFGNNNDGTAR